MSTDGSLDATATHSTSCKVSSRLANCRRRRLVGLSSVGTGQPVAAQSVSAITAAGRVEGGGDVLSLGTSATGTIAALLVKVGDHVQPGQHLVRVECSNVERELEARKSDLAAAEAFYLRTLHGPRPEEISVGVANVNLADARLQEAQKVLLEHSNCTKASP
jgi:multidrug efflux pump subunit AcrA (membrane-fusion protein)